MKLRRRIRKYRGRHRDRSADGFRVDRDRVLNDGGVPVREKMRYHAPTDELLVEREQVDRGVILERNARLRAEPEAFRKVEGMRLAMQIPVDDLRALVAINPELRAPDSATRRAAWLKFLRSPESLPYRVTTEKV